MAVPFNMPEDQNEVEVLLMQLQTLLNKLQIAVRKNQQLTQQQLSVLPASSTSSTPSNSRVRHSSNNVNNNQPQPSSSHATPPPDLLTSLSWLAGTAAGTSTSASPLTAISIRSPRRRTISETSNTDETKISITAIVKHDYCAQDFNKIDCVDSEISREIPTDGLLSKIMPASVSSCSLMTAMICFVGWHIFRAR
ncbi:unnamed protein product [Ceutorhynchus assimilis]|uniref:Uncharacterized protein n=1 Tax=Ceutorhynchus assimilis TaxID=467358 RepID=A0A9N9MAM7_9CUCU|nr:unnamed protein product [Ceutorhynchus assimilis]